MSNSIGPQEEPEPSASRRLKLRSEVIDLAVGLCLALLALAFWLGAAQFAETDVTGIGPATFPRAIALLFGLATIILIARAVAGLRGLAPIGTVIFERPGYVIAGIVSVALFPVLLLTTLGYYIATALWMPAMFLIAGYRKPLGIVLYTVGFLVFTKVAFEMILGVRLP